MSTLTQPLLLGLTSLGFCVVVVLIARRRLFTLRYTLGWLTIGFLGIVGSLLAPLVEPVASALDMTPTGLLLAAGTAGLLAICVQLSISVSGLQARLRDVIESEALLTSRLAGRESTQ